MTIADSQFETARVYHDFNSLAQLKTKGRDDNPDVIREAARQFESVFVRMMLKSMRDANGALIDKPLFDSPQMDLYRDMHDEQLSLHLSSSKTGVGLTDILVQQLTSNPVTSGQLEKTESSFNPARVSKTQAYLPEPSNVPVVMNKALSKADDSSPVTSEETVRHNQRGPDFSTPVAFVQSLWQDAEQAAKALQLDPKVLIAQAALETGWGKHVMQTEQGNSSKNLFGIKASHSWNGEKTQVSSLELENGSLSKKKSSFRVYNSYADSFADYAQFIGSGSRYQNVRNAASDPVSYMQELQSAGYATDPEYAQKISKIYHSPTMNDAIRTLVD